MGSVVVNCAATIPRVALVKDGLLWLSSLFTIRHFLFSLERESLSRTIAALQHFPRSAPILLLPFLLILRMPVINGSLNAVDKDNPDLFFRIPLEPPSG